MNYDLLNVEQFIEPNEQPSNSKGLSALNGRHELVAMLYLEGLSPKEIAVQTGYNKAYISQITADPLVRALVKEYISELDQEFRVLYRKAIDAIRDGLDSQNIEVKLKAAEKYLRSHGKYGTVHEGSDTAEDVIKRILELKVTEIRPAT